ncbi:T-cell surface antigen CD2-like [Poeciliopsis prolifica]|uniref:T-cell surface antigen CD2-like n=1 Tax=Poeciliopsis prolifica TaxID=188132 RepID=UPI0024133443|nr:T-cell surface antigen CD2-like [Poeciliopsis prolifica]
MQTMACFIVALGQIVLFGFIAAAKGKACDIYAFVGESVTLSFDYEGLTKSHFLRWTHNSTIVFSRAQNSVKPGKPEDITPTGSLLLKSVKLQSSGTYQANAIYSNGTMDKTWTAQLCVMENVPKPRVNYSCGTNVVKLNCEVSMSDGVFFSWTRDKKLLPSETRQTLSISLSDLKEDIDFSCSVANKVSAKSSDTVRPTCTAPMVYFKTKTVLGVLAGGAGLIFLLLVIIVVLCRSRRRAKSSMQLSDRVEFKKREAESIPEYESIHNVETYSSPSPQPSPRACYQNI